MGGIRRESYPLLSIRDTGVRRFDTNRRSCMGGCHHQKYNDAVESSSRKRENIIVKVKGLGVIERDDLLGILFVEQFEFALIKYLGNAASIG